MAKPETDPLELQRALERFDITADDSLSQEAIRNKVLEKAGFATQKQIDAFFDAGRVKYDVLAPRGITPVEIKFQYGRVQRFAIKGQKGLFGRESVLAQFPELEEVL